MSFSFAPPHNFSYKTDQTTSSFHFSLILEYAPMSFVYSNACKTKKKVDVAHDIYAETHKNSQIVDIFLLAPAQLPPVNRGPFSVHERHAIHSPAAVSILRRRMTRRTSPTVTYPLSHGCSKIMTHLLRSTGFQ